MTNKERQKNLDKKKWAESELQHQDMSGRMLYCKFCKHNNFCIQDYKSYCDASQATREAECLCARAFNRMKRGTK